MNYKDKYKSQIQENLKNVINELETKDMKLKISNWANKFGYSFNEIKEKIINDEIFRCVFAKDPAKQNLYQNLASKYISSLDIVENFKVLPAGGKDAIYLTNGKILKGDLLKNQSKDIKSIDFIWNSKGFTFYASHKYTEMNGGAQDNQYKDIQDFLNHSRDCNEKSTIFLAICDGDYYLQKDSKTGDETKIKRLQRLTDNKTSFALNINELKIFLENF
jgi:autotransporter adhesin